jgi:hypothetical protein
VRDRRVRRREGATERERGKKTAVAEIEKTNKVGTEIATSITKHTTPHNATVTPHHTTQQWHEAHLWLSIWLGIAQR